MVLLLGIMLVACDYSAPNQASTSGSGGAGGDAGAAGSGNAAGNGGAGGGGMSIPACSDPEGKVALEGWPWFGFEQQLPDPMPNLANGAPAAVVAVELGGLRLKFDGAATDVRLAWAGPDLNPVFMAGDMVTVTVDAGLQDYRVTGNKGQAVVLRYANATVPAMIPAIPGGGPNLALETECVYEQTKTCPLAEKRTLYSLIASTAEANAKIPSGMTGQVGTWHIKHIKSMNLEYYTAMDCMPDKFFDGLVQALEVKP